MTTRSLHRITCLLCLLIGCLLPVSAQHYRIDYDGEELPDCRVSYYPGEILRDTYTDHAAVSFANCFSIKYYDKEEITDITLAYVKGEASDFNLPIVKADSTYNVKPPFEKIDNHLNNRKYCGYFFYPYLKTGLAPGIYRDTLLLKGQFRGYPITFSFFIEQQVAYYSEVYIDKGESYSFYGKSLTASGRYVTETEVLDLTVVEPCEVHIEASQTFITQPADIQLSADREGDYYEWTGYGLDDPAIRNPKATIDTDGEKEYKMELTAFTETGPNLAQNGSFEFGYTGFATDYIPVYPQQFISDGPVYIQGGGHYSLVAYPQQINGPWAFCRYDGYLMVVDGGSKPVQNVFATTVSVEPHTYYAFSVDVASVSNIQVVESQPLLQFYINGETLGEMHRPETTQCDWKKIYQIWYSDEVSGNIQIILRNTQTRSSGNDFAIDNVSFRKLCRAHDELTIKANFSAAPDCQVHIVPSQTELCHTGDVQLSTDIEADYYLWNGYGINDPAIREPVATFDQSGDYTYDVTVKSYTEYGDNLITNGDFEQGNTGFTTDYTWMEPNEVNPGNANRHINPGKYSIVDYPLQVNWPWAICTYDGKMMVVDGKNDNKNNDVFRTEVDVLPNTWYAFSCEVSTISDARSLSQVASLQFYINGETFSQIHHPDTAVFRNGGGAYTVCRWKKIYQLWYSGNNDHIVISLQDHNGAGGGNDFAVDNLRFLPVCEATDTIHIRVNATPEEPDVQTITACGSYTWHDKTYTSSGKYKYETKTDAGCDIVEELDLTIAQPQFVPLTATACDSYTWHGTDYTESGTYRWETQTLLGCDSVEELTLTIHPSYLIPDTVITCDTYTWQGETYTLSGDYRKDYQTLHGCDSVFTLHLTVNYSGKEEEEMIEYKEYMWKGQTYTATGDYSFDTLTTHGCDSLVTLHLTIVDTPFVAALLPVADLCADDKHVAVEYTLADVILPPQHIDIIIDHPKFATFHTDDLSGTALITLPDSIRPDWYSGLFRISYKSYVQELPFTFLVRYPSTVIGQKWNNVLALKNSRYNGGWLWDAYRWYVDGREMPGETQSFIYCGPGNILLMGHPYHASLRRVGEDYFIPTCPIIPVPHEDIQPIPTIFYPGQRIVARRDGQDIPVTFYDMLGRVVAGGIDIDAPAAPGVYMLETDGQIQKIIVR